MSGNFCPVQRPSWASASVAAIRRFCLRIGVGNRVMKQRDWLLLFAAYEGAPDGLDPIRFQKGLFLFARRTRVPARSKYRFEPYDYGPMSTGIYRDLDRLVGEGLLECVPVSGKRWSRYKPNKVTFCEGERILKQAEGEKLLDAARELFKIKQDVSSLGFNELLEQVYAEHPEYAVNSIFRRSV
jgi:uncharacterized protein YwgA